MTRDSCAAREGFFSIAVAAMVGKVTAHKVSAMQTHDLKACNVLSETRQDCEGLADVRSTGQTTRAVQFEGTLEKLKESSVLDKVVFWSKLS